MTMDHWWRAIIFVTSIAAYVAVLWILLAFARHAHQRILIMLNTGYYWKDAGQILRREARKAAGPKAGAHRAPNRKQERQRGKVEILSRQDEPAWEDPHSEDIIDALKRVDEQATVDSPVRRRDPTVPMGLGPSDLPTHTVPLSRQ